MSESIRRRIELDGWQGEIVSRYDHPLLRQALSQLPQLTFSPKASVLMEGRNRLVCLNLPLGQNEFIEVVVKEFRSRGLVKLRALLTGSKARRSFYGSLYLKENLIKAPEPVAYLENRSPWQDQAEYFLATRIKDSREIRFYFQHYSPEQLDLLLLKLAAFCREMHGRGVFHRDLSDGNILVREMETGNYEFFLLDTNRVRLKRRIGRLSRLKNLIRLGLPPSRQRFFLEAYFEGEKISFLDWLWYRSLKGLFSLWIKIKKWLHLRALARRLKLQ